jgi:hypothetical protein
MDDSHIQEETVYFTIFHKQSNCYPGALKGASLAFVLCFPVEMPRTIQGSNFCTHAAPESFVIHDLHGRQTAGSYYSLTDRDPGPSFAHLTQGIFLTGPILAPFTILYRAPDSPEVAQALQAFANATYVGK